MNEEKTHGDYQIGDTVYSLDETSSVTAREYTMGKYKVGIYDGENYINESLGIEIKTEPDWVVNYAGEEYCYAANREEFDIFFQ